MCSIPRAQSGTLLQNSAGGSCPGSLPKYVNHPRQGHVDPELKVEHLVQATDDADRLIAKNWRLTIRLNWVQGRGRSGLPSGPSGGRKPPSYHR
eukprot:393829-Heterocapsa_arctica.AAC.1